ncbi:MAG: transglycosylase SLT domain-containing protein, partial [Betaproteobacteria bacterium]
LGESDYRPSQIGDIATNARFGTFYFKYWLDKFDNLPLLAVAGYNAGPGRAQAWRAKRSIEGAIYAETIPFNETRDYVKKVLANAVVYARQSGVTSSLKQLLAVIPPRGGRMDEVAATGQAETEK